MTPRARPFLSAQASYVGTSGSRMRCVDKGQDMLENDSEATFKRMVAQVIRRLVPVPVHTDPTVKVKNLPPLTSLLSASHMYALDHAS